MATSPKLNDSLTVVNADVKKHARLDCIKHLFNMIGYEELTPGPANIDAIEKIAEAMHEGSS